jgi:cyanophycin synthetase
VVAAARGEVAWVLGDGRSSIIELVDAQINTDPRRGIGEDFPLNRIWPTKDSALRLELQRQGFTPESVPGADQRVLIQRNGNVANDCTDLVHPEVAHLVTVATRVVGLDIAGVDLVAEDISRPLAEQGAAIVEINAGPGLLTHLRPATGEPRPVGQAIAAHLFPDGASGRIPLVGVAGRHCTTEIARMIAWLLRLAGHHVGLACADGLFLDRRQVSGDHAVNFDSGLRVLMNRSVTAAVFETHAKAILNEGLPYDRCSVAVVTDVQGAAELGEYHIEDDDQVYDVLRTQVDVVLADGYAVLNAADPRAVEMAELCEGTVILYGLGDNVPAILAHRAQGGRAAFFRAGRVFLATGSEEQLLEELGILPESRCGCLGNENIVAAVAAAWALGLAPDLIGAGIETFEAEQTASASGAPVLKTREH